MSKFCQACGMPLIKAEDFANGDQNSNFCLYCVNEKGEVKSCEEIFEGGVQFFLQAIGSDRAKGERLVRKNMIELPYWQHKDCKMLKGEMATEEEFSEALKNL